MGGSGTGNVPTLGGWVVTVLLGVALFYLLRHSFAFHDLSAAGFGLAASLFMLLLLTGSGPQEDPDAGRVRKIVPAPEFLPPIMPAVVPTRVKAARAVGTPPMELGGPVPAEALLRLEAPRGGKTDDLTVIEGIGPALEKLLHAQGVFHIDQIAGWTEADVTTVDAGMANFKGRIARDRWVEQARIIVTEGLEAFRERAKTNNY